MPATPLLITLALVFLTVYLMWRIWSSYGKHENSRLLWLIPYAIGSACFAGSSGCISWGLWLQPSENWEAIAFALGLTGLVPTAMGLFIEERERRETKK